MAELEFVQQRTKTDLDERQSRLEAVEAEKQTITGLHSERESEVVALTALLRETQGELEETRTKAAEMEKMGIELVNGLRQEKEDEATELNGIIKKAHA